MLLQYILAVLLPPVAVAMTAKKRSSIILNIILCFVVWLPAVIHALYVVTNSKK